MSVSKENKPVVGVCGNEARIYGPLDEQTKRRPLQRVVEFPHHGAAVLFAQEFEDDKNQSK